MTYFHDIIFTARERRQEALDECRAHGRLGGTRLPLAVASDESLSDTAIMECQVELEKGQAQRTADRQEDAA